MQNRYWILGLTILTLLLCTHEMVMAGSADNSREVAALGRFETVVYSKTQLLFNAGAKPSSEESGTELLRFPFHYLFQGLSHGSGDLPREINANSKAFLVGASDFRSPTGLGTVRSKRCYIIFLNDGSAFNLGRHFRNASEAQAAGNPVWNWTAALSEFGEEDKRLSHLYATQIGHAYVLVANDLKELQIVAVQLSTAQEAPASSLPHDWALLSKQDYWAYRRYQLSGVADKEAAATSHIEPGTDALIFYVDSFKKNGVLRLVGSAQVDRTAASINGRHVLPTFKRVESGVWEANIPLSKSRPSFEFMTAVLDLFGFGVYL